MLGPDTLVYVGTYTKGPTRPSGRAEGIYVCQMDPASGALSPVQTVPGVVNPSFLALNPGRRFLYAVNETSETDGQPGGGVGAFAIDERTGGLTLLNRQPSHGTDPCHLSVDHTGRFVLVANYGSGSVAMYPMQEDGRLGPASDVVQHAGSGVNPERQAGPHAHSITPDPANRFALACDLGLDQVVVYRLDLERGKLVRNEQGGARLAPGSGPRHLDFHPNGRYVYVINELSSTLTAFAYDPALGALQELQTLSTLPSDFSGRSSTADVHVHPNGKLVFGSNRGHDSIARFAIDESTGRLTSLGWESTRGRTPRNFAIDPTGTYLLAANQGTDNVVTFRIDPTTGSLQPGPEAAIPSAVCLKVRT